MSKAPSPQNSTPAQKAMKQTSKTSHEVSADAGPPSVPDERPDATQGKGVSEGDKPVGESGNNGSSPYEEPHHLARRQRSD
jgi:hypothetical protein